MAATVVGPTEWSRSDDNDGYRSYSIVYHVKVDHVETADPVTGLVTSRVLDGPQVASTADGLPQVGDGWVMENEDDPACRCQPAKTIEPKLTADVNCDFFIKYTFSNKPLPNCQREGDYADPLLVPPRINVVGRSDKIEPQFDRFNKAILNSSHEPLRGREVEFDRGVKLVRIAMNLPEFDPALDETQDYVNDSELYGYAPRCVRVARVSQECKCNGDSSYVEATVELECDRRGQDRLVLDEGTKTVRGNWVAGIYVVDPAADPANPQHFQRFVDRTGNPCRVILDGFGAPADVAVFRGALFVSLTDANLGNELSNSGQWLPITGPPSGEEWTAGKGWKAGQVVQHLGHYVIALTDVPAEEDFDPLTQADLWFDLGESPPVNMGFYSESEAYFEGHYVQGTEIHGPGKRLVQYYPETDLILALGIPASLECHTP